MCGLKEVALLPSTIAPCCERYVAVRVQRTRPRGWQCCCFVITFMFVCTVMRTNWEGVWWYVSMTGLHTRGAGGLPRGLPTRSLCGRGPLHHYFYLSVSEAVVGCHFILDHTQRRTTVSRTPLDEWVARYRDLYLTTHNTHNRQASMPPGGIRTHNISRRVAADLRLDRAATETGGFYSLPMTNQPANSNLGQHRFYQLAACLACLYLRGAAPFSDTTFRKTRKYLHVLHIFATVRL
jgi:hypothetical protein